ncbi:MAG: ATP synthase F0F1 subunit B [Sulfurovum sp. FS08-3]|nr:MAG: ATP synthase F0F1 subunit B [Sulfurovum sp. FS08-3]
MLDLHLELMLAVLFVFFLLLFVLNTMLYKPLLDFMNDRDGSIANDLKSAKELTGNTDELNAQAANIIDDAKSQASAIREKMMQEAKAKASEKIASKQGELEKEYQNFLDRLNQEKEQLKNALLNDMPTIKSGLKTKLASL